MASKIYRHDNLIYCLIYLSMGKDYLVVTNEYWHKP